MERSDLASGLWEADFPSFRDFLRTRLTYPYSRETYRAYRTHLNNLFTNYCPQLGIEKPEDIPPKLVELQDLLSQHMQPVTVSTILRHLKAFLHWCYREGRIPEKPVIRVKNIRTVPEILSDLELKRVLAAVRGGRFPRRDRAILVLMSSLGLRRAEVCRLREADYREGRIRLVQTKTGQDRYLPVPNLVRVALDQYLQSPEHRLRRGYLFQRSDGGRISVDGISNLLKRLSKRSGVHCHPHMLRHYFALTGVQRGVPPFVIQEFLGHTTLEMTRRYVRLSGVELERWKWAWD